MKRFWMVTRIVGMFFAGLVVSVAIAMSQLNLETFRATIVDVLARSSGLPVEIRGSVSWKFSLRPQIVLNNVVVPNAKWAANINGVEVKRISARLNLISLLIGDIGIDSVTLDRVNINIEENAEGEYSVSPAGFASADASAKFPIALDSGLHNFNVTDMKISLPSAVYEIADLEISHSVSGDTADLRGSVKLAGRPYVFSSQMHRLDAEKNVYPVRVAAASEDSEIAANVMLAADTKMPADFSAAGHIEDIAEIARMFAGAEIVKIAPFDFDIKGARADHKITIAAAKFKTKKSDVEISGSLSHGNFRPLLTAKIKSNNIVLGEVFTELYGNKEPWVRPKRALNVFKDTPLYGDMLSVLDADIELNLARVNTYREMNVEKSAGRISLHDSVLDTRLDAKYAGGEIALAANVKNFAGELVAKTAARGTNITAARVLQDVREKNIISGLPTDFQFFFEGYGRDLSQLMSTVTGKILIRTTKGGKALSDMSPYLYGEDFLTNLRHSVTDAFKRRKQYANADIKCAVVNLHFVNGRVETQKGIALESSQVNMRGAGYADLGAERVKASIVSVPNKGLKVSLSSNVVNAMEFDGNMAEPDWRLNGEAVTGRVVAATGIGLLLAPFTGGVSLLAGAGIGFLGSDLLSNWLADDAPCRTALNSREDWAAKEPEFMKRPLNDLVGEMLGDKKE